MKSDFIIIFITCASSAEAGAVVDSLLRKRLIACGNVICGIRSRFWWKKRICDAREVLILAKAEAGNFVRIEKEVKKIHGYEVPEIIAAPIVAGSKDYLDWLKRCRDS